MSAHSESGPRSPNVCDDDDDKRDLDLLPPRPGTATAGKTDKARENIVKRSIPSRLLYYPVREEERGERNAATKGKMDEASMVILVAECQTLGSDRFVSVIWEGYT